MHFFLYNHYWQKDDGALFSSARNVFIDPEDENYQSWLASGYTPTPYPKDEAGNYDEKKMYFLLYPHGLMPYNPEMYDEQRPDGNMGIIDNTSGIDNGVETDVRYPEETENMYNLNSTGIYHKTSCGFASASGRLLTLEQIFADNANAKPCSHCKPPLMFYLTDIDIYHASGCPGLNEPGKWTTWDDICMHHKTAEPCADCLVK